MSKAVTLNEIQPFIEEILENGGSFSFMPKGKSMLPLIIEGSTKVAVSPVSCPLKKYDIILYKRADGQFVLHRIVKAKNEVYTLCGDNQVVYEHNITKDMVIGIVTAINTDGKNINSNNLWYLITLSSSRLIKKTIIVIKRKIKTVINACKR